MTVRVRFAPNPSGELHMGGARTALFNWLFARHEGGTFVLRIEDTDPETAKPQFIVPITSSLEWLGMTWDEGPYRQSERADLHQAVVQKLVNSGAVYRCWCTREDVSARGTKSGYDRFCRERTDAPSGPYALRFRTPIDEPVAFDDLILGPTEVRYDQMQDFVVARSNGTPVFELANVADDHDMRITHAIRANDLLASAGKNVLLFRALGWDPPKYGHLPLVLDENRRKLSKREEAMGVMSFQIKGYLPEAIVNFLALLGWSSPSGDEVLKPERIVEEFTIDRVHPSPAVFDLQKLEWMNSQHIQAMAVDDFVDRVVELFPTTPRDTLTQACELGMVQQRAKTLDEVAGLVRYLHEPVRISDDSGRRFLGTDEADTTLQETAAMLARLHPWSVENITESVMGEESGLIARLGLNRRKGPQPIRVAVTGSHVSLPLWESIYLLGRDESVQRLRAAVGWSGGAG